MLYSLFQRFALSYSYRLYWDINPNNWLAARRAANQLLGFDLS